MGFTEKTSAGALIQIKKYVYQRDIDGLFEAGHGYSHHYSVTKDAILIARKSGLEVDLDVLIIAASIHDLIQRGQLPTNQLPELLIIFGLENNFIMQVIEAIDSHSLNGVPNSPEGKILWLADKINYASKGRYEEIIEQAKSLSDSDKKELAQQLSARFKDKWVDGVTNVIPNSPIFNEFPIAKELFEKRLAATLQLMRGDDSGIFSPWLEAYDQQIQ